MNCLKCGRECEESFCTHCLEDMKRYPVKPGLAIHLPPKPAESTKKSAHKKKELSPEERISILNLKVRSMRRWIAALVVLLIIAAGIAGFFFNKSKQRPIGQNYVAATLPTTEIGDEPETNQNGVIVSRETIRQDQK